VKRMLEAYLLRQWYANSRPNFILFLASGFYRSLQVCHRALYKIGALKTYKMQRPVIVVGNFTAGGTGKTPFVIALVNALQSMGWHPGVVSRGYGRSISTPISVESNSKASEVGDEPLLIFKHTQVPVRVDSNRVAAAQNLIAAGCNIIIADDGLQHYRLQRDVEIEIFDSERGYGNGLFMPAGPLRERPRACDFKVISAIKKMRGDDDNTDATSAFFMQMQIGAAYSLVGNVEKPLSHFQEKNIIAIAGIGNPSRFFNAIKAAGIACQEQAMPDHHVFTQQDFQSNATYLMTEKDAVKCNALNLPNAWVVPLRIAIDPALFTQIDKKLKALV
jgi:tetraacyldisaccharide 4'-kinase